MIQTNTQRNKNKKKRRRRTKEVREKQTGIQDVTGVKASQKITDVAHHDVIKMEVGKEQRAARQRYESYAYRYRGLVV